MKQLQCSWRCIARAKITCTGVASGKGKIIDSCDLSTHPARPVEVRRAAALDPLIATTMIQLWSTDCIYAYVYCSRRVRGVGLTTSPGSRPRYLSPYLTLSNATQASFPPSNPHPTGPKSHSAQTSHFTFPSIPFVPPTPGRSGGRVIFDEVSGLENPILSKAYGSETCQ